MINENTLNFIRFSSGFNNLKKEELEAFAENEIFELNEYNASEEIQRKHFYTSLQSTDGTQGVAQEDGKYKHTAWAYSSDGTDGFTTVYPNLNLLDGTAKYKFLLHDSGGTRTVQKYDDKTDYIQYASNTLGSTGLWFSFTPEVGQVYTLSADVCGNGHIPQVYGARYEGADNGNLGRVDLTNEWQRISNTFRVNAITGNWVIYADNSTLLKVKHIKIEKGSTATPYMPSASEVTTADYPSYMGQYTDYTLEDSINPSSYTWREIKGKYFYTLEDVNTNGTLKSYIIECLKLSLQTRWGNNLEYHIDRKTKYLNKLTGMQA